MNYWVEIFDKEDTNTIVDSFESFGSAYTFQNEKMQPGDIIFIYSISEGRFLYRAVVDRINGWKNEDGSVVYCNAVLKQPMLISDVLKKESVSKLGFNESKLKSEEPNLIESGQLLALLNLVFDNEEDYISKDSTDQKIRIIYTAKENCK